MPYIYMICGYSIPDDMQYFGATRIMERYGFKIILKTCQPMTDCYWFKVENKIDNVPKYIVLQNDMCSIPNRVLKELDVVL